MKRIILALALVALTGSAFAQKKTTSSATVSFDATTPKDAFPKAENKTAIASLNTKTSAVAFEVPVKNFVFPNATIQEHFNGERWLNSDKYKTFTFAGKIVDPSKVNFGKDGSYTADVAGKLTVKDKTNDVTVPVTFVVKGSSVTASSSFDLTLADYGVMADGEKISKTPKVNVNAEFK
ncbi:MAG: hypothetical protein ABS85_14465 [Sphingobacteriales bacterium SCN 48-20]|jgi:polyisoprenoid-binding protein YceI|uniref:YceI family protein n=1 Tax=Terrimonas ferruginea TaxID=249 RepID=UPI0003FB755C|nr:YceI family protein [Terrimonas ferruginea]MBN8784917.1 YceI family protein [Terrimonas ferruginea]ODT90808.1 MAG: hypothetical protein ABS85_14465 [Sphingobacteriales bacterium SCN 48-20]OJW44438.1 MAG: hypothetical protein BGO56_07225 [Sphingobacteriales bacterium 48-107]